MTDNGSMISALDLALVSLCRDIALFLVHLHYGYPFSRSVR